MSSLSRMAWLSLMILSVSALAFGAEYKPGEVIIKYKPQAMNFAATMNAVYDAAHVKKVKRYSHLMDGIEHLILADNVKVEDAIQILEKSELIEYAQPNYILYALDEKPAPSGGGFPIPCIPGFEIPGCDPNATPPGGGLPGMPGLPCIPGFEIPGCDPKACIFPGIPFPPGCEDSGNPGDPGDPGNPGDPNPSRPDVQDPPAEGEPKVDPNLAKAWGLEKIKAPEAWKIHKGSKDIIVADIDTGVDYNHEDLSFNMWRNPNPGEKKDIVGYDFIHNDGLPYDDNEHGTHTSGTIGAVGENGIGVSGVAPRVSIMALKFLSGQGSGTTADAVKAIDYAIEHGAKILSNSWGGPAGDPEENKALSDAIERAKDKGVLFIAAAGNDGADNDGKRASYPAAYKIENIIAVAATDERDGLAFFSNYGKTTTHLAAPGVNTYSTTPKNKYASHSGTSMACPHVAGAAALVWSKHPEWNYKQVKQALLSSVDPLPVLRGKTITGGRLNVLKALQAKP